MTSLAAAHALVFDERFRFDTFVAGASTRDAVEAARVVAESPGARWNPLIVRGAAGAGKSHLLGAIARRARELTPSLRVVALSAANADAVRAATRDPGALLLVDDVRGAADAATASELRALVDAALAAGCQVVIAEDGAAAVSREEAGAWVSHCPRARLVRLGAPDGESRAAIVRNAASARGLLLADDVLASLAADPVPSVRELLGRLSRVAAAPASAPAAALDFDSDFASFLDEVAREVAAHVEPWRLQLGEAASRWRAEGIVVDVLERALKLPAAPDVDALLATFDGVVARLRDLARAAAAHDAALADDDAFRDPARLAEAEAIVRRASEAAEARARAARRVTPAAAAPAAPRVLVDAESWVLEWPDVADLVIEAWR